MSSTHEATESPSGLLKEVEDLESQIMRIEQNWETAMTELLESTVGSSHSSDNCLTETGIADDLLLRCPLLDLVTQLSSTAAQDLNFVSDSQYSNYLSLLGDVRRVVRQVTV